MNVLFCMRSNHTSVQGGDLVQQRSTAEALRSLGVAVDFSSDPRKELTGYNLVHVFNFKHANFRRVSIFRAECWELAKASCSRHHLLE